MRPNLFSLGPILICSTIAVAPSACGSSSAAAPDGSGGGASSTDASGTTPSPDTSSPTDAGADAPTDAGPLFARTGGTFAALSLDAIDGTAFITPARDTSAGAKSELRVLVADRPSLCSTGPLRGNATIFSIDALSADATFRPGTFTQMQSAAPGQVDVSITKLNASCGSDNQDYGAAAATVTITTVTPAAVAGTFDVTLTGKAGTLRGTFNVPVCGQAMVGTCQP